MGKKQIFYVYVGQLKKEFAFTNDARNKNSNIDPNKSCLYVGYSSKPPRERWNQHLTGSMSKKGHKLDSRITRKWAENYIHWKKFEKFNPIYSTTNVKAKKIEKLIAEKYSDKGHAVWSDMLEKRESHI